MDQIVENVILFAIVGGAAVMGGLIGNIMGFRSGRKIGRREGFQRYVRELRFERRAKEIILPTGQPHSRRPKGAARVSDAHMSQVRRHWLEP